MESERASERERVFTWADVCVLCLGEIVGSVCRVLLRYEGKNVHMPYWSQFALAAVPAHFARPVL